MNMLIGRTFAQTFQLLQSVKQHNSLVLFSDSGETAYARISQLRPGWEFNPTLCDQSVKAFSYCHISIWLWFATLYLNQGHSLS